MAEMRFFFLLSFPEFRNRSLLLDILRERERAASLKGTSPPGGGGGGYGRLVSAAKMRFR